MNVPAKLMSWLLLGLIGLYRYTISAFMGRTCRYLPTCSDYASQAIKRHGAWAGFWLGFWRVGRCHPWGSDGFDPVPEKVAAHGLKFWKYRAGHAKHLSQNGDGA